MKTKISIPGFRYLYVLIIFLGLALFSQAVRVHGQGQYLPARSGGISSELQSAMDGLAADERISVIVRLDQTADLQAIHASSRAQKRRQVINALQNLAASSQASLRPQMQAWLAQGRISRVQYFWIFNGLAVTAPPDVIEAIAARPEVSAITLDAQILAPAGFENQAPTENHLELIQAPALWQMGFTGQGIVVASMDTGVYLYHPDLYGSWRGGSNSWYDPSGQHPTTPSDYNGHGTWTMGSIVGGDLGGTSIGVAPDASWIAVKIFDDQDTATTSGIHAGFQWLLDPDGNPASDDAPDVVNNSWTFQSPGCDLEFELDLQALRASEILPVFAAGNSGPGPGTSVSPSNNPSAFAVGATDDFDLIYSGSARGPAACGEPAGIFPELVAPGVDIHTTDLGGFYTNATGTSLSAPQVTGALALLLDAFPGMTAERQAQALVNSALDLGSAGADDTYGFGRLDISAAYQWLVDNVPTPTPVPTNLALNRPVSVSSEQDGAHSGQMAVDGDGGSFWQSKRRNGKNKPPTEWITVDLGAPVNIDQVVLDWDAHFAITYDIQLSTDNSSWTTVFSTSSGTGGVDNITFSLLPARYVRMLSTAWDDESLRSWLREFEIYGTGGNPSPTPSPTPAPTGTPTPTPTPSPGGGYSHVGDLDGASSPGNRNRWDATVSAFVVDQNGDALANAVVSGSWTAGASGGASCTTGSDGWCSVTKSNIKSNVGSVSFAIEGIASTGFVYDPGANSDPDGDSDGSLIVVLQP